VATVAAVSHPPTIGIVGDLLSLDGTVTLSGMARGTQLYAKGDSADRVFVLTAGRVKTFVEGPGGKNCLFQIVETGELFGENALMGERIRQANAEVLERAAISMIPVRSVKQYIQQHPEFWLEMTPLLRRRMRDLEQQIQWVSFLEVEHRLARLILRWTEASGGQDGDLEFRLSQRDLAAMVGATRETTSSALNRLQRDGCIEIRRRMIVLTSLEKLRDHAGEFTPTASMLMADGRAPELVQATGA